MGTSDFVLIWINEGLEWWEGIQALMVSPSTAEAISLSTQNNAGMSDTYLCCRRAGS